MVSAFASTPAMTGLITTAIFLSLTLFRGIFFDNTVARFGGVAQPKNCIIDNTRPSSIMGKGLRRKTLNVRIGFVHDLEDLKKGAMETHGDIGDGVRANEATLEVVIAKEAAAQKYRERIKKLKEMNKEDKDFFLKNEKERERRRRIMPGRERPMAKIFCRWVRSL